MNISKIGRGRGGKIWVSDIGIPLKVAVVAVDEPWCTAHFRVCVLTDRARHDGVFDLEGEVARGEVCHVTPCGLSMRGHVCTAGARRKDIYLAVVRGRGAGGQGMMR